MAKYVEYVGGSSSRGFSKADFKSAGVDADAQSFETGQAYEVTKALFDVLTGDEFAPGEFTEVDEADVEDEAPAKKPSRSRSRGSTADSTA